MLNSDTRRRLLDGLVDRGVSGAAAQVAADGLRDLIACWAAVAVKERLRREEHPWRAVAALCGALLGERGLQRMQIRAAREALDRGDVRIAELLWEREARQHRHAVDEHRARAALAELAAVLRAGEVQLLAQHLEQRVMRLGRDALDLTVHAEGEHRFRHFFALVSARFAASPRRVAPLLWSRSSRHASLRSAERGPLPPCSSLDI